MFKKNKIERLLKKITGVSTPFFGVSWKPTKDERVIIYKLIVNISNRRLLDRTHGGFRFKSALNSIEYIRNNISDALIEIGPDSKFRNILEIALEEFKIFQTVVENEFAENNSVDDIMPSNQLLGAWRMIRERAGLIFSFLCYSNEIEPPSALQISYDILDNYFDENS